MELSIVLQYVEVAWVGEGQQYILQAMFWSDGITIVLGFVLTLVVAIIAGIEFFGNTRNEIIFIISWQKQPTMLTAAICSWYFPSMKQPLC
jgi:hypothetical protein